MPGIAGIISKTGSAPQNGLMTCMLDRMLHEKFYSSGSVEIGPGIKLGWVSHKGAFADCLPIWNETKDVCLIFNGEEFNGDDEIARLKSRGHSFAAHDASYLVHMYEEYGSAYI